MYKIVYKKTSVEFYENKAPAGWHPLWDLFLTAEKLPDISENIFSKLSESDIESIYYFFFDLETSGE